MLNDHSATVLRQAIDLDEKRFVRDFLALELNTN